MIPWPCVARLLRGPTRPAAPPLDPPAPWGRPRPRSPLAPYVVDAFEPAWVHRAACAAPAKTHGWEAHLVQRAKKMGRDELAQAVVQTRPCLCVFGHRRAHALLLREWMQRGFAPMAVYLF